MAMDDRADIIERAFQVAIELHERGEGFPDSKLSELCGHDASVRAEVASLLQHLNEVGGHREETGGFLNPDDLHGSRAAEYVRDASMRDWNGGGASVGQRVGDFTIIGQLGTGGMGIVYVAEQQLPRRTVALKVIKRSIASASMVPRFEREAELLGRLNHPGIAQIYGAGIADVTTPIAGEIARVPYIAMELVHGQSIREFVRSTHASTDQILSLIAQVCDAIQHAHQRGVIHRDLKPANILVTTSDADAGSPQVKVLDFGVARFVSRGVDASAPTDLTMHGGLIGTLAYISPEQIDAHGDELDTRTDVYSIGAILYELLAGELPIPMKSCSIPQAVKRVIDVTPEKLSRIDRRYRGDVETIVAMALEKDRARRYSSPADLARDIRHFLAGEPIEAKRDSVMYLVSKRAVRYRNLLAAMSVLAIALVGFLLYARSSAIRARAAQRDAEIARAEADRTSQQLADELAASRIERCKLMLRVGDAHAAEETLWDEYFNHPDSLHARWALWELYSQSGCLRTIGAGVECRSFSVRADSQVVATAAWEGFIRLWNLETGAKLKEIATGWKNLQMVQYARDGTELLACGDALSIIDADDGHVIRTFAGHRGTVVWADLSNDGRLLLSTGSDGSTRLWDAQTTELLCTIPAKHGTGRCARFDHAITHAATSYTDGTVSIWSVDRTGEKPTLKSHVTIPGQPGGFAATLAFSPDDSTLLVGFDRTVRCFNVADGAESGEMRLDSGMARGIAFHPDGKHVATLGYWIVQLYDAVTKQRATPDALPLLGMEGGYAVGFTPDGTRMLSTGAAGAVRVWQLKPDGFTQSLPVSALIVNAIDVRKTVDAILIAAAAKDGTVAVWKSASGATWERVFSQSVGNEWLRGVALSADGKIVFSAGAKGVVHVHRVSDGALLQDLAGHRGAINRLAMSPDGRTLASCGYDTTVRLWQRDATTAVDASWKSVATCKCPDETIGTSFSADSKTLVSASRRSIVRFWSVPDGALKREVNPTPAATWTPALSPDGKWLAIGEWDRSIEAWDVRGLLEGDFTHFKPVAHLFGHAQLPTGQSFDASSRLLATTANDGLVKLWDFSPVPGKPGELVPESRRSLATLDAHAGDAHCVAFLPAPLDHCVAAGYRDGTIRIWDLDYFNRHIEGQRSFQQQRRRLRSS